MSSAANRRPSARRPHDNAPHRAGESAARRTLACVQTASGALGSSALGGLGRFAVGHEAVERLAVARLMLPALEVGVGLGSSWMARSVSRRRSSRTELPVERRGHGQCERACSANSRQWSPRPQGPGPPLCFQARQAQKPSAAKPSGGQIQKAPATARSLIGSGGPNPSRRWRQGPARSPSGAKSPAWSKGGEAEDIGTSSKVDISIERYIVQAICRKRYIVVKGICGIFARPPRPRAPRSRMPRRPSAGARMRRTEPTPRQAPGPPRVETGCFRIRGAGGRFAPKHEPASRIATAGKVAGFP